MVTFYGVTEWKVVKVGNFGAVCSVKFGPLEQARLAIGFIVRIREAGPLRSWWKKSLLRRILLKVWAIKCKNYLLKIYAPHINFLNTIWNFSVLFISPGDSAMKIPSILEKFNAKPRRNALCLWFQLMRNVRFRWNMCSFQFNFLSRGHLESLNLDRIFLPLFKILPCYEVFLVTYNSCHYCSNIVQKSF